VETVSLKKSGGGGGGPERGSERTLEKRTLLKRMKNGLVTIEKERGVDQRNSDSLLLVLWAGRGPSSLWKKDLQGLTILLLRGGPGKEVKQKGSGGVPVMFL